MDGSQEKLNSLVFVTWVTLQVGGSRLWSSLEVYGHHKAISAQDTLHENEHNTNIYRQLVQRSTVQRPDDLEKGKGICDRGLS